MPLLNQDYVQPFLDHLKFEKRYSPNTLISYQTDLSSFIDYIEQQYGSTAAKDIVHLHVRSWIAHLKENHLSSKSLNRKISCLKTFFKYEMRQGRLTTSPMLHVISPKISRSLPSFLKEAEAVSMINLVDISSDTWKSLNAKLLINIFYATGMRLSELISLKEKAIDFSNERIKVLGKGNKERIIPVSGDLLRLIKEYQAAKRKEFGASVPELLVTEKGNKLYPKYAYLLVKSVLGEASTIDKKSPHVLRHSFATHLMNNGADLNAVKELLGHTSLAATQVYTHNTIQKLKDIHMKAHPKS